MITGIVPPLVTPLLSTDTLDEEGLERLINHLVDGGVSGLFVLGTTGESQSLSVRLRQDMIRATCRIAAGRLPVLVGISDTSLVESINLARFSAECGAAAVVSAPPYYFAPGQPELAEFYEALIPRLPLPVFLYNMPSHVKVSFAPATVARIAQNPQVVGFKDSSANGVYFQSVMHAMRGRENFSMLVGPEEMTAECVMMGAHGGVNGGANMFPQLYVSLYEAAKRHDIARVHELQRVVMQISSSIYNVGQHGSSYLKGLKCALSLLGICGDTLAEPFFHFREPERQKVAAALEKVSETLKTVLPTCN